ncbi:MAG: sulfatase-like hydrolase/transferase [Isosphaeraceae bacterium]|nr:sulfatase-like hydrolase/transferase [Isosphaeraceae bacterium]
MIRSSLAPFRMWPPLALGLAWLGLLGLIPNRAPAADPPQGRRPNILFLFTDDQRADTIHALDNPTIQTPNLDRLAQAGFVFRNTYCMGGNVPAVCLPSRTMLLSGRSLFHLKDLTPDAPTLPKSLRAAGYLTYHHGKKGNSPHQIHRQFDQSHYLTSDDQERRSGYPGREIANDAIRFLRGYQKDNPFFMHLAFANPHDPRVVNPEDRSRYDEHSMPLPQNFQPLHPFNNGELTIRDEALAPWPRSPKEIRRHLTDYYGVITHLDAEIGRILKVLEEIGEYDNTIILFSSDHGLALGSHGLMGKQNLYEDGMKVPLIFAGPGIPKGQSDAFAYLYDIYPTICDLVGAPIPEEIDGQSLAPILRGKAEGVRDAVFLAYRDVQRAVRQGDWKLIRYPQINKTQLFNLKDDPGETKDLADDPRYADRVRGLMALLEEQQRVFNDHQALTSEHPQPAEVDESFFRKNIPTKAKKRSR